MGGPIHQNGAISEDLRRRTTGSLFQTPHSHNNTLTKTQVKSHASRPAIIPVDKNDVRDPSDVISMSTG